MDASESPYPHLYVVILAGGSGTRLWPLSRSEMPKQFLSLDGTQTMLDATAERLAGIVPEKNILVVTAEQHARGQAYNQLSRWEVLVEPEGRNTAPAIASAAALLAERDPAALMLVLPADHYIADTSTFQDALRIAVEQAGQGRLATFGIRPTRPETGFGYIRAGDCADGASSVRSVAAFVEKPGRQTAEHFVESGDYFWNSGMFAWSATTILSAMRHHAPEIGHVVDGVLARRREGETWQQALAEAYPRMPDISIDYAVMEKAENVVLVPCDCGWSDVGSWDAVHEVLAKDPRDNAQQGNVLALDCENSLLISDKRLLAAVGVRDLCVVETADAVLVVPRHQSQRVKELVGALSDRKASEHRLHVTVQRPWGRYTVLEDAVTAYKIKRIEVDPGCSLSLQSHQHRSEHWVVVSGTATVTCHDQVKTVARNQSTYIPIGEKHRLANRGRIPLVLIEVQVGEYLEEDDIERFEDDYGRIEY